MSLPILRSAADLQALIDEIGVVPLFRSAIPGFSVEEMTPDEYWFKEGVEGPWNWREQIAMAHTAVYAKLLQRKAGFVSLECFPRFANFRRDGYDYESRRDEGLIPERERRLYELISSGVSLTNDLKKKFAGKGFDVTLSRLQMQTYVAITGFTQRRDKFGVPYGWRIGVYAPPEMIHGALCSAAYEEDPAESYAWIVKRLQKFLPGADTDALLAAR